MKHARLMTQVILAMLIAALWVTEPMATAPPMASAPITAGTTLHHSQLSQGQSEPPARTESSPTDDAPVSISGDGSSSWSMAGANPQRTSWTLEEVRGNLQPVWYRPIEPYISQNVQIIAVNGLLYVSTARGLYALDAATGHAVWTCPTELPLGHSPTYHEGVLYVGGLDRKLHAIDAVTGERLWAFEGAKAGYRTNPLVVNGLVLVGNRDGWFYAIHAHGTPGQGTLAWKYQTGGPILYSAAYRKGAAGDDVIFFASQDMHAYALYAQTGALKWKSQKLHGAGFNSSWPVIWRDKVVLTTVANYRNAMDPGATSCGEHYPEGHSAVGQTVDWYHEVEGCEVSSGLPYPQGTEPGDWVEGTRTYDASPAAEYFETYPWRRSLYTLDAETGADWGFDYDGDGELEYAPISWTGTKNGIRPPPMVSGFDDVLYQQNNYGTVGNGVSLYGHISGWKLGTPFISQITNDYGAWDEPHIASGGGSMLYWSLCCDREAGGIDISKPLGDSDREWQYYAYDLAQEAPGYDEMWEGVGCPDASSCRLWGYYGSMNGIYHNHTGDQNPWVPYNGHLYIHRSNAVLCFGPEGGAQQLPLVETQQPSDETLDTFSEAELKQMLADEIQKWLDAGHLHPGWFNGSQFAVTYGPLNDYFQNPAENIWALLRALPHLSPELQQQTRDFIQSEYQAYDPTTYAMTGWAEGATRDWFLYPPEVEGDLQNFGPSEITDPGQRIHWWNHLPPMNFYALWKYAEEFGGAAQIYDAVQDKLSSPPDDTRKQEYPYELNAYIAGYWGYLELERMAGQPESPWVRDTLQAMLQFRTDNFSKDTPFPDGDLGGHSHPNRVNISRNFIYMTPELGQYLHDRVLPQVQEAAEEYEVVAPYWFVSRYEGCLEECTIQNLHDAYALFQAKAWILQEPREELLKYLDVPGFMRGDLFYIHNLISAIEAQPADTTPPSQVSDLVATAATDSQIDLSWSEASDGESGIWSYNIYRDGVPIATPGGTNYSDTGLSPSTPYTYQVSAVNGAGLEGPRSTPAAATTLPLNPPPAVQIISPAEGASLPEGEPVVVEASADDDGIVTQVAFGVREDTNVVVTGVDTDGGDGWSFTWSDPTVGSYDLTADATDDRGKSTTSPVVTIHILDVTPPMIASVHAPTETQVVATFNEAVDQATAETAANYTIDHGIAIVSAALTDSKSVGLSTSELSQGVTHTLTVNNVEDLACNPIEPDSQVGFVYE